MWNAFGNGSGLHGGGGGGGYVSKAQGWEFVPCSSRLQKERGRRTSRSPLRTLSSPASVGPFYEQLLPGLGVTPETGAQAQSARQDLQSQHARLKKKFEDLKKRHGQDKEEWMREKEMLLRQVAEIQGGENRRILLDLKSVLEDVQLEVKKEETKRNELQLLYTKDRCAWELERAELKCRIAQLEARGSKAGVEVPATSDPRESLRREREEQKRLLADTHTAAMDLRCRLEHSERGWAREKTELLERFDAERKEWESQLRDMQRKIEELYNEVKARREGGDNEPDRGTQSGVLRLSLQSTSTSSSVLTDPPDSHSNTDSGPPDQHSNGYSDPPDQPDHHSKGRGEPTDRPNSCYGHPLDRKHQSRGDPGDHHDDSGRDSGMAELELILQSCLEQGFESGPPSTRQQAYVSPISTFSYGSDKKRNTMALNAALREIARVSQELCSYQDEIRKKSEDKRSRTDSFLEDLEELENLKNKAGNGDTLFSPTQWCDQFQVPEEQNWISWERVNMDPSKADEGAKAPQRKSEAPPVPPRTTSWYRNSPTAPELELPVPESTDLKCHSPCVLADRKCPSVLRKFGAMLQENEGSTLTDSGVIVSTAPADSKCNIGCCHSRWACDGSKFGSSKSSTYVPVQKRPPDANILAAEMDCGPDCRPADNPKCPGGQFQPVDRDFVSLDLRSPPSGVPPPYPNTNGSRRNETLELKTAEFNRTLFQVEMGRWIDEDNAVSPEISVSGSTGCSTQPLEIKPRAVTPDLPPQYPEIKPQAVTSDRQPQHPEIKSRAVTSDLPPQVLQEKESDSPSAESNLSAFWRYVPSVSASAVRAKAPGVKPAGMRQASEARSWKAGGSAGGAGDTVLRILKDQPWKPTTLAAYPRPADSRSNYGAVEKILKSFESFGGSQQCQQGRSSLAQEDDLIDLLDMLEVKQQSTSGPGQRLSLRDTSIRHSGMHRDTPSALQESRALSSVSTKKSFSRPARPANRRLPSRWASRSPSTPSDPAPRPSVTAQAQTFSYSYHTETVII
ncbi:hypothetical protein MATL_G00133930 [Megalops atlanticus]|uniref:SOGA 1/2-like coiled-coil domain-containing protein n=1 Tax=Megalops atlanticus TaxID=7932 RepID=A0A9D3TAR2_MEGAT|nr:hypothetical protein MATL_G00133930 [Megalops atlanticus]